MSTQILLLCASPAGERVALSFARGRPGRRAGPVKYSDGRSYYITPVKEKIETARVFSKKI